MWSYCKSVMIFFPHGYMWSNYVIIVTDISFFLFLFLFFWFLIIVFLQYLVSLCSIFSLTKFNFPFFFGSKVIKHLTNLLSNPAISRGMLRIRCIWMGVIVFPFVLFLFLFFVLVFDSCVLLWLKDIWVTFILRFATWKFHYSFPVCFCKVQGKKEW